MHFLARLSLRCWVRVFLREELTLRGRTGAAWGSLAQLPAPRYPRPPTRAATASAALCDTLPDSPTSAAVMMTRSTSRATTRPSRRWRAERSRGGGGAAPRSRGGMSSDMQSALEGCSARRASAHGHVSIDVAGTARSAPHCHLHMNTRYLDFRRQCQCRWPWSQLAASRGGPSSRESESRWNRVGPGAGRRYSRLGSRSRAQDNAGP